MDLHNSIYFMIFPITKFYEEQFLQREIFDYWIALPKKHSLIAIEDDTRGMPQRIGSSQLNLQTFLRFFF